MDTSGLIFIPDISGFTRFVKTVEIDHSRLIIQELLEILIDANEMGLTVSEIEGDAILFYKFGEKPSPGELYYQVKKMFTSFHKNLMAYEARRYCQCEACLSAINLTLKVITHYGEFTEYSVKQYNQLIGKDVIVAHQLLKNDIDLHEYWLVTPGLFTGENIPGIGSELKWRPGQKLLEEDSIQYHYAQLGFLKGEILINPPAKPDLTQRKKVMSMTQEYHTDLITLLHATADFTYRNKWMEGVKKVIVQNHFLPRIGMRTNMILENGETTSIANHYSFGQEKIEFSEIDEQSGHLSYYMLEKLGDFKTKLSFDYYVKHDLFSPILFSIFSKRELNLKYIKSFQNLGRLVEQLGDSIRKKSLPGQ